MRCPCGQIAWPPRSVKLSVWSARAQPGGDDEGVAEVVQGDEWLSPRATAEDAPDGAPGRLALYAPVGANRVDGNPPVAVIVVEPVVEVGHYPPPVGSVGARRVV